MMTSDYSGIVQPTIHKCDGCGSWAANKTTLAELEADWGWLFVRDPRDGLLIYCPECR